MLLKQHVRRRILLLLHFCMALLLGACGPAEKDSALILAFVPHRDSHALEIAAGDLAEEISANSGLTVRAITLTSYSAVLVAMKGGHVDLAFVGPVSYVMAKERKIAMPLTASVRSGKLGYNGVIVTRVDSEITDLTQLRGGTFAFGDALSTSGNLYPKALMREEGIDLNNDIRSMTMSSHGAILMAVLQGKVDAGAVYADALKDPLLLETYPNVADSIRIIATTSNIPPDLQIARTGLSDEVTQKLRLSLVKLADTVAGRDALQNIVGADRLVTITDDAYSELSGIIRKVNPQMLELN